jgi:hypothetical protein
VDYDQGASLDAFLDWKFTDNGLTMMRDVHRNCAKITIIKLANGLKMRYFVHYECAKRK